MPNRQEWASRFGCTQSLRVSIGVSPRSDLDYSPPGGARDRFWHYVDAYPAIQEVMRHYEEVPDPYGKARIRLSEGDRALQHLVLRRGFPLGGKSRVFRQSAVLQGSRVRHVFRKRAARATAEHLKDPERGDFAGSERLLHSVYRALSMENEALYRSWASPSGFERVLMAKLAGALPEVAEPGRGPGPRGRALPDPGTSAREGLRRRDRPDARRRVGGQDRSPEIEAGTGRYLEELRTDPQTIEASWAGSSPTTTTIWSGTRRPLRWRSPACSPLSPARAAVSPSTRPWAVPGLRSGHEPIVRWRSPNITFRSS